MSRLPDFWLSCPISLRWAIAISLALHFFVIFPLTFGFYAPIAIPQAPLSAVLRGAGETIHDAATDARRIAPLSAGDTKKPVVPIKKLPTIKAKQSELGPESVKAVPVSHVGVAQGDTSVAPNVASKPGVLGGAPDAARDGVEADALQRYRLALGAEARKAKRYPEVSRARGNEGVCEVIIVLSKNSSAPTVIQGRTSGSQTLDEAAFAMAKLAVERTSVPAELQGRNLRIPLRIRFTLDDF